MNESHIGRFDRDRVGQAETPPDASEAAYAEDPSCESEFLRDDSQLARIFLDHPDSALLWRHDDDGAIRLEAYNPASYRKSQGRIAGHLDMTVEEFFVHEPGVAERIRLVFETGCPDRAEFEYTFRTTGETCWVEGSYIRLGERLLLNLTRDIDDRKRAERKLHRSEERFRRLAENCPDIVYRIRLEPEVRFEYLNPRVTDIVGYTPEEHYADPELGMRIVEPADRPMLEAIVQDPDHMVSPLTLRWRHRDGHLVWTEHRYTPIVENGRTVAIEGVARDVTERKMAEEALIQSQQMNAVGVLAGGVAHEFNNLHAVMLGYLGLVMKNDEVSPHDRRRLTIVMEATRRASRIIQDLLAFARRDAKHRTMETVNDVIERVLSVLRREFESDGVIFDLRLSPVPQMPLDNSRFGQVVLNLLINARHAVEGCRKRTIVLETGRKDQWVFVRVKDTGIGIPPEQLDQVFLPFFTTKGEHATPGSGQTKFRGHGLGLSVVRAVVEEHRGQVEAHSEPGVGSTFTVWLPLQTKGNGG